MGTRRILVGAVALSLASACSKTAAPTVTTASAAGQAFAALNSSISALATPAGGAAAVVVRPDEALSSPTMLSDNLSDWSGSSLISDPRNSGDAGCAYTSNVSPETYMRIQFTESAVRCNGSDVNVFGRVHSALSIACILAHVLPYATSADMPTSGSATITFDATTLAMISTDCHKTITAAEAPDTIGLVFSVPTDTTNFERLLTATFTQGGVSDSPASFYLTYNSTKVAYAGNENNSRGANRVKVLLDRTNQVLKGEYLSGPTADTVSSQNNVYLHRLYYDAVNDKGRAFTSIESSQTLSAGAAVDSVTTKFVVTEKPKDSTQDASLALDFWGLGGGSYATSGASYNLQACVVTATGLLSSNGSTSCGTLAGVTPASAVADAAAWSYIHTNLSTWYQFTAVPTIAWDYDTIHTAGETL